MRKITVVSTSTDDVFEIESSAETWGELSRHDKLGGAKGMRAMIKENRNTLENEQAILPQGDFTLYLSPSKVKSGFSSEDISDIEEIIEILEDNNNTTHLVRFMKRLKNGSSVNVTQAGVAEEKGFPITSSGLVSASPDKDRLLREARELMK